MANRYRGRERDSASWKSDGSKQKFRVPRNEDKCRAERGESSLSTRDDGKVFGNGRYSPSTSAHSRTEEGKISTQVRIMARLESLDSFRRACQQVQDLLFYPENKNYVIRFFSCLTNSFSEVFKGLSAVPWREAGIKIYGKFLSTMFSAMDVQSNIIGRWLMDKLDKKCKTAVGDAIHDTIIESVLHLSKNHTSELTLHLLELLDDVSNVELFKKCCSIFVACLLHNRQTPMSNFEDFIDIVVGWMIDDNEKVLGDIYIYCYDVIQHLEPYFREDLEFIASFLTHLLAEIEGMAEPPTNLPRLLRLIKAVSAFVALGSPLEKENLKDISERLLSRVNGILIEDVFSEDENTRKAASILTITNETVALCQGIEGPEMRKFLKAQLSLYSGTAGPMDWTKAAITKFVSALTCWIETVSFQAQPSIEVKEMLIEVMPFLDTIQPLLSPQDQFIALKLVHGLLRTRCILLLQNVYLWVLSMVKIEQTEGELVSQHYTKDVDRRLLVLAYLADIATNKSGSILSLWALNPSIIDFLMSLLQKMNESDDYRVRCSALELLKSHAIAHSHFVSSISSAKTYYAESPAQRFLVSLMDFWVTMIRKNETHWNEWVFDWVSIFLQTSSSYASILLDTCSSFYRDILKEFSSNTLLRGSFGRLLEWMAVDTHYKQSDFIQSVIRESCLRILLQDNVSEKARTQFSAILKLLLPNVIILHPELEDSVTSTGDSVDEDLGVSFTEDIQLLTLPEFNRLLMELLLVEKGKEPPLPPPSRAMIKSAVDFLIRSKLKSDVGRPQDLFGHLQIIFRKGRRANYQPPIWKLEFAYELEKKIILCIHQSTFLACDVPEPIRSFYVRNSKPCTEWLKRMVPDLIEISLALKCYSLAYYFSASSGDDTKAKIALLEMEDTDGLRGMGELGGYYYLSCEYEKAEACLKKCGDDATSPLKEILLKRTDAILNLAAASLEEWPDDSKRSMDAVLKQKPSDSLVLKVPSGSIRTVLNIQLDTLGTIPNVEIRGGVQNFGKLKLMDLLKVEEIAQRSKNFSAQEKHRLEFCKVESMIQHGNLAYAGAWLTRNSWDDTKNQMETQLEVKASTFKIFGDMLYKEGDFEKSADLYSSVYEMVHNDTIMYGGDSSPHLSSEFRANVYLHFAHKIKESDGFFQRVMVRNPSLVEAFEGKYQIQQALYERAREAARSSSSIVKVNSWFDYATFAFDRSDEDGVTHILREVLKSNALHSYANYIKWTQKGINKTSNHERKANIMTAMIRILKLYKQGHTFIPEDLITDDHWLLLLPELAKIEELRPFLLSRFPKESSFLVATLEHGRKLRGIANRRGVFDPATYAFTEATEDPLQPTPASSILWASHEVITDRVWVQKVGGRTYADSGLVSIVEEIERVGTTREEVWSGCIQRISSDWLKRVTVLRKDLVRDKERCLGRVQAYVIPLLTYFTELWNQTKKGDTPAEVAFICRSSEKINNLLSSLADVSDADSLWMIHDQFVKFAASLDSSVSPRLFLINLSPNISKYDFANSSTPVSLPGFCRNVTVSSVQPVVTCLATKSKPKRITFRGSDGKLYEYLIKGNENLNIDSGIMQLLRIAQEFSGYTTRSYSVTPIGERGGLIQIVKNAVPLFVVYKKYLRRHNLTERPSEMYWRLLNSLGYTDRSDIDGLKEVFRELVKETPSELILRDLLLCADNTTAWYKSVGNFTRDCAMASTIGYVVGLGDRHLDNILINPSHGHLVHVDFSILFGKGTSLKIPERVPFRLTQNLVAALQYPGVNGAFRIYLDKFLQQFKQYEEMVMFCIKDIAPSSQLEERLPIDPEILLRSELRATFHLLKLRIENIWKIMEIVMNEAMACVDAMKEVKPANVWSNNGLVAAERLKKKVFRYRRLLYNLDPLIQFLATHTKPTKPLERFHQIVFTSWNPCVMSFWFQPNIDQMVRRTETFDASFSVTETTLQVLSYQIPAPDVKFEIDPASLHYSEEQALDPAKTDAIINTVKRRVSSYNQLTTAKLLIEQSTNEENLAQIQGRRTLETIVKTYFKLLEIMKRAYAKYHLCYLHMSPYFKTIGRSQHCFAPLWQGMLNH